MIAMTGLAEFRRRCLRERAEYVVNLDRHLREHQRRMEFNRAHGLPPTAGWHKTGRRAMPWSVLKFLPQLGMFMPRPKAVLRWSWR